MGLIDSQPGNVATFPFWLEAYRIVLNGFQAALGALSNPYTLPETIWVALQKWGENPQNGWFIMANHIFNGCFGGTPIFGLTPI